MTYVTGPILVELVRSGVVESVHTGHLVVLGPGGEIVLERGRPELPVFWRSAAKPLQATAVLATGVALTAPQQAIAAASHSGEPEHVETVLEMLADGGLREDQLGCPPDWPMPDRAFAEAVVGQPGPRRVYMNCSGKHAAMLRACRHRDWPLASYLDVEHPLQAVVRETVESLAHERIAAAGVDGCGLPLFALSLTALARSFGALATGPVADAMRAHPLLVGGTDRLVTRLLQVGGGLLAKDGAEGVFAAAWPDGSAVACSIDDGASRAAEVLVVAALGLLGGGDGRRVGPGLPPAELPVLGGGRPVGAVRMRPGALPAG